MANKRQKNPEKLDPALGGRIRALRVALGDSQEAFGSRFEVNQATVSRWERGYYPDRIYHRALARLAGQTVQEFLQNAPPPAGAGTALDPAAVTEIVSEALPILMRAAGARESAIELATEILLELLLTPPLESLERDRAATARSIAEWQARRLSGKR